VQFIVCFVRVVRMRVFGIAAAVVAIDQATKWLVLQMMHRHQSIPLLGDWLQFTFTENPGMAFGIEFGPPGTVAVLSVIATGLVAYYIAQVRGLYWPYRASLAFILGGAIGNIIDRVFYGVWLGYGELFQGRVVDFIHVSLWQGFVPPGVPLIGGSYMELFPIWNVADMAIVCGVAGVLFFHNAFYEAMMAKEQAEAASEQDTASAEPVGPSEVTSPDSPAGSSSAEHRRAAPSSAPASSSEDRTPGAPDAPSA
jgi:signal peptidase II